LLRATPAEIEGGTTAHFSPGHLFKPGSLERPHRRDVSRSDERIDPSCAPALSDSRSQTNQPSTVAAAAMSLADGDAQFDPETAGIEPCLTDGIIVAIECNQEPAHGIPQLLSEPVRVYTLWNGIL